MTSPTLTYAFEQTPETGAAVLIAPGLHWVRHALPMELDHINVWVLSDETSCSIVDTGINTPTTRDNWHRVLEQSFSNQRVARVIATHLHPDHCGVAGWLTEEHDCPLWMTRTEYLLCRTLCHDSSLPLPPAALDFYRAAGLTEAQLEQYAHAFGGYGRSITPLPPSFRRLQDGDTLELHGERWQVVVGTGHSPEHACLLNAERNILISGDQILPRISSIISVWPTEPTANPLAEWLQSCRALLQRLPDDVLVLPSHGRPFRGAHTRLQQLIEHHERTLDALYERCREPQRVIDVFDVLFGRSIDDGNRLMAVGESIAHLNYLQQRGQISRRADDHGVHWFQAS